MEEEVSLQSGVNITVSGKSNRIMVSNRWVRLLLIATAVKSILGLIVLLLLLGVSLSVMIIGFRFRQVHHCPIEENISLFLIVAGSVSVEWIILSIILSIITMVLRHIQSLILVVFIVLTALIIIITHLFLFIWVITGSMWTLKALNMVQYTNPYVETFCEQILYQFTLGYLVMIYVLFALQCWYRLFIVIFCSIEEQ
jgi:hypothetical protein